MGMLLNAASSMVILAPFFYQGGIGPVHLGAILTVNGATGMFTRPFGVNLFVASSLGDVDYMRAAKGCLPFIGIALITLATLAYIAAISLWLSGLVYGGS